MKYTPEELKKLRAATGADFFECKYALDKAEGDFEKARQIIVSDAERRRELEKKTNARDKEITDRKKESADRKKESADRKKLDYLENQKSSKIATVEQEIAMLKNEILEIKKAHNALIVALKKEAPKNPSGQSVRYGTLFFGDFSE
jgi:hypothetical protein